MSEQTTKDWLRSEEAVAVLVPPLLASYRSEVAAPTPQDEARFLLDALADALPETREPVVVTEERFNPNAEVRRWTLHEVADGSIRVTGPGLEEESVFVVDEGQLEDKLGRPFEEVATALAHEKVKASRLNDSKDLYAEDRDEWHARAVAVTTAARAVLDHRRLVTPGSPAVSERFLPDNPGVRSALDALEAALDSTSHALYDLAKRIEAEKGPTE